MLQPVEKLGMVCSLQGVNMNWCSGRGIEKALSSRSDWFESGSRAVGLDDWTFLEMFGHSSLPLRFALVALIGTLGHVLSTPEQMPPESHYVPLWPLAGTHKHHGLHHMEIS